MKQVVLIVADVKEADGDLFSFLENELRNQKITTVMTGVDKVSAHDAALLQEIAVVFGKE